MMLAAIGCHQHHGRSTIALETTIEETKGLDDPARCIVGRRIERTAVHDRALIGLRVVIGRHGNSAEGAAGRSDAHA
jgi:hypothetical protein